LTRPAYSSFCVALAFSFPTLGDGLRKMKSKIAPMARTGHGSLANRTTSISESARRAASSRLSRISRIRALCMRLFIAALAAGSTRYPEMPFHPGPFAIVAVSLHGANAGIPRSSQPKMERPSCGRGVIPCSACRMRSR
jgi:hypothetical protein